jgi:hypothetical protein
MRKLLAIGLCSMFVIGDATIYNLQTAQAGVFSRDERGEAVLRQAREALGGDAVINAVQNLLINGKINHKIKTPDGQERSFDGNVEMALETSGKLHKNFKIGDGANLAGAEARKIFVEKVDIQAQRKLEGPEPEQFHRRIAGAHGDELSRLLLGLLLKTSPGLNAVYNYAGETSVDGTAADVIEASSENGFAVKLYIDKNSHLPLMMSYRAAKPMRIFVKHDEAMKGDEAALSGTTEKDVVMVHNLLPEGKKAAGDGEVKVFVRKKDENGNVTELARPVEGLPRIQLEEADFQVRFSDYRSVNGLMLPHRIAQTVNGEAGETMSIENYQINAANVGEKFKDTVRFVRKPAQK